MNSSSILSAITKLRSVLTREEKFKWLGIVCFALVSSLFEVITASVIVVFAQVLNQPEMGQKYVKMLGVTDALPHGRTVLYFALAVGGIYVMKNLVAAAEVFYQNFSIQKMNYHFKNKMLHRYAEADYGFYLTRNSSLGIAVVGDISLIFSNGMLALGSFLSEILVFSMLISMIIFMNPFLALLIGLLFLFVGFLFVNFLLPRFYEFGLRLQESGLYGGQNLMQFFHSFKEMIVTGKKNELIKRYERYSFQIYKTQALQSSLNILPRMVIEVLFVGVFVVTIIFLCLENESPSQMLGLLGGYLYAGFRLMPGLNRIINQLNNFKSVIPSIYRVENEYHTVAAKENYVDIPNFQFNSNLGFHNVSFRYLNAEKDALKGISLTIKKGECIGIVGETGSGKSTLVDVLLGLLRPYEGRVLVDGEFPVNSYQWHQKIGYVPQSIYLTDDTIAANIAFGEANVDAERLQNSIDAAQLRKFIDQLPDGDHTIVGERGVRLSGGERQRIAIARALYRQPEVLIFDEATSALDNETETRLMETIHAVSQNRTVIMIAHRLSTLENCNRIIKVEQGKILYHA